MNAFEGISFESEDGIKTKHFLEEKLKYLREQNDNLDLGIVQTTAIRGQIALIKSLLKGPAPQTKNPSYYVSTANRGGIG